MRLMRCNQLAVLAWAATLCGCFTTTQTRISRRITLTTTPEKAHLWRQDIAGRKAIGRAPLAIEETYKYEQRRLSVAAWSSLALGAAASVGTAVPALDSANSSTARIVLGTISLTLVGLVLSVLPGLLRETNSRILARPVTIGASSPGYSDAWRLIKAPASLDEASHPIQAHLRLSPAGGAGAKPPISGKRRLLAEQTRRLKRAGRLCYRLLDYRCALRNFRRAYRLQPNTDLVFNIASAHDKVGHAVSAVEAYMVFLRDKNRPPQEALTFIRQRLTTLFSRVCRLELQLAPVGVRVKAKLTIDGRLPRWDLQQLVMAPGKHTLAVRAAGYKPAAREVDYGAGKTLSLQMTLEPLPSPRK
jgi:tetratricopeptide (TPR) repeat protein